MTSDESLARFGIVPGDSDLEEIRRLLAQEADAERQGHSREEDLALLCAVQLFSRGLLEDVLRIWNAKRSGFDLGCSIDVQLLCGPGLDEAKHFLTAQTEAEASEALRYIEECESAGNFEGFSPAAHLSYYKQYFGVR